MLRLAAAFLLLAVAASLFGFAFLGGLAFQAAKAAAFLFVLLAVLSFAVGALPPEQPPPPEEET